MAYSPFGVDLFGGQIETPSRGPLADRFEFPPFTVLNAREGPWQERKAAWLSLGIKSEVGRGSSPGTARADVPGEEPTYRQIASRAGVSSPSGAAMPAWDYRNRERGSGSGSVIVGTSANGDYAKTYNSGSPGSPGSLGREYAGRACRPHVGGAADERPGRPPGEEYRGGDALVASANESGTSIFDPVLTEIAYRWFCPAQGQIVDPFAGGSVRGLVAGLLGFKYHGIDLRAEQIAANTEQRATICPQGAVDWVCGDSIDEMGNAPEADFIFSCPPYGDLERYSDDPKDLSTMEYHTFLASYKRIILRCFQKLKPNRLACFVVGDFRDKRTGMYRGFLADTVNAFRDVGMPLYNDAVLITAVGSLPIRVGRQFDRGRKLGKTHQNVLVFAKGDPMQVDWGEVK